LIGSSTWCAPRDRGAYSQHALIDLDKPDLVGEAVRCDRIAVRCHIHIAHDVAAARNRLALDVSVCGIEATHAAWKLAYAENAVQLERHLDRFNSEQFRTRAAQTVLGTVGVR
jgi:hypothetical protein